jgi:hypothetical protein
MYTSEQTEQLYLTTCDLLRESKGKANRVQRSSDLHLLIYFRPHQTHLSSIFLSSRIHRFSPPLAPPPHPSGKATHTSRAFLIYMPKSRGTKPRLSAKQATYHTNICTQGPRSSHHRHELRATLNTPHTSRITSTQHQ